MKMFIWEGEGVLQDYTSGMIVAIAADLPKALAAIEAKCDYCMDSFPKDSPTEIIELGPATAHPNAWVCYGGG